MDGKTNVKPVTCVQWTVQCNGTKGFFDGSWWSSLVWNLASILCKIEILAGLWRGDACFFHKKISLQKFSTIGWKTKFLILIVQRLFFPFNCYVLDFAVGTWVIDTCAFHFVGLGISETIRRKKPCKRTCFHTFFPFGRNHFFGGMYLFYENLLPIWVFSTALLPGQVSHYALQHLRPRARPGPLYKIAILAEPTNLFTSKHHTQVQQSASIKSLLSKMMFLFMFFCFPSWNFYFVEKVGVQSGPPAPARQVPGPFYFVEKMITGMLRIQVGDVVAMHSLAIFICI